MTQLHALQDLSESIEKEYALVGASSCVLACAIQALRAGVPLGVNIVDIIVGREVQEGPNRNDIADLELSLAYSKAEGLSEETVLINMSMYLGAELAGQQQVFFLHMALKHLMSRDTTTPLTNHVGGLIERLMPDNIARQSTNDAMSKLCALIAAEVQPMTEERAANVTAAMSDLESDMTFKDLLDGTHRGRVPVRSLRGLLQQRLADMLCKTQLEELAGLVNALESRLKIKWRGDCCMVSVHENARFISPCLEGILSLEPASNANFMAENKDMVDRFVNRVSASVKTLVDAQRLQQWRALTIVAEHCATMTTSKTTQGADDETQKLLESPAMMSVLTNFENSGLSKVLKEEERNNLDEQIAEATAARAHLTTFFDKMRSCEFETTSFFTENMVGTIEVLSGSDCHESFSERYSAAMGTIKNFLGKQAAGHLEALCGKYDGVAKGMTSIINAKDPRRLATFLGRDVTAESCMEDAGLVPNRTLHMLARIGVFQPSRGVFSIPGLGVVK